jgi:hypothetical protein
MAEPIEPTGIVGPVEVTRIINSSEISRKIQKKLIIWTTFSVLIGSFPIILNLLILFAQNKPIYFFDLFAHGELLLISIAIAAGAMGDMIYSKRFERVRDIASICTCFIIILFSISWFASLGIGGKASNTVGFGIISIVLFIATVFVSGNCEAIVEVPDAI